MIFGREEKLDPANIHLNVTNFSNGILPWQKANECKILETPPVI